MGSVLSQTLRASALSLRRHTGSTGTSAARRALLSVEDNAWSAMEATMALLLKKPVAEHGYGIRRIRLNERQDNPWELVRRGCANARVPDIVLDDCPVGFNYDGRGPPRPRIGCRGGREQRRAWPRAGLPPSVSTLMIGGGTENWPPRAGLSCRSFLRTCLTTADSTSSSLRRSWHRSASAGRAQKTCSPMRCGTRKRREHGRGSSGPCCRGKAVGSLGPC